MEIFILYKFYISFIFKTYFLKKKKKLCPKPELQNTPVRERHVHLWSGHRLPGARTAFRQRVRQPGALHFRNSVCNENPALSASPHWPRGGQCKSASFIDYQMICASVPHPVRAHRAADRRLSCVFNLDASTVAYCCSINTPSSGITGNTAGMSLHEPLTVTALLK